MGHAAPPFPRKIEDEKFLVWGVTDSGRPLQVVFIYQPDERVNINALTPTDALEFTAGADVIYVIHAMTMSGKMKRSERRHGRGRGTR